MTLAAITRTVLDEASTALQLRQALDNFALLCSDITGIVPDPGFDAWAQDTLLDDGVAINPAAAAHCIKDYVRSAVFIRAVYAALKTARARFPHTPIQVLYAGCGPFATLLLPLLGEFIAGELDIHLLDIHRRSLRSVQELIAQFGCGGHRIHTIEADACSYQHPDKLHLIIAETMQKSLEQEPQFAVTANLAPQLLPGGIFIPEKIEVELCLAHLASEIKTFKNLNKLNPQLLVKAGERYPLATVFTLLPALASRQLREASRVQDSSKLEIVTAKITIPRLDDVASFDALLFTRIQVFGQYQLRDYEAEITLPQQCHELASGKPGDAYQASYQLGSYPKFNMTRLSGT